MHCLIYYSIDSELRVVVVISVDFRLPGHVEEQLFDSEELPKQKSPPLLGGGLSQSLVLSSNPVVQLQVFESHAPQFPFAM